MLFLSCFYCTRLAFCLGEDRYVSNTYLVRTWRDLNPQDALLYGVIRLAALQLSYKSIQLLWTLLLLIIHKCTYKLYNRPSF